VVQNKGRVWFNWLNDAGQGEGLIQLVEWYGTRKGLVQLVEWYGTRGGFGLTG